MAREFPGVRVDGNLRDPSIATKKTLREQLGISSATAKQYGAAANGTDDDETYIDAMLAAESICEFVGVHASAARFEPTTGQTLSFADGSLKRLAGGADTGVMQSVSQDNLTFHDLEIDCNSETERGLTLSGCDDATLTGLTQVSNVKAGGDNTMGGIITASCERLRIEKVDVKNANQVDSVTNGLYRAFEVSANDDVIIDHVNVDTVDIGFNCNSTTNLHVGTIVARNVTDNGVYILGTSADCTFDSIDIEDCAEGIVVASGATNANLSFGSVKVQTASVTGIALRTGEASFGHVTLVDASITNNSGYSGATFGTVKIRMDLSNQRPVTLATASNVFIGSLDIDCDNVLSDQAVRLVDCDNIIIGTLKIRGTGGSPVPTGLYISGSSTGRIFIGAVETDNVTTPFTVASDVTSPDVTIRSSTVHRNDLELAKAGGATLQVGSATTANTAGNLLGEICTAGNDDDDPGKKFRMRTEARNTAGAAKTDFYDDDDNVVGRIIETGGGFTVNLPNGNTNVPTGGLYYENNVILVNGETRSFEEEGTSATSHSNGVTLHRLRAYNRDGSHTGSDTVLDIHTVTRFGNGAGAETEFIDGGGNVLIKFLDASAFAADSDAGNPLFPGILLDETTAEPADPADGRSVLWMSNGTGFGDDGDLIVKITAGGATKTVTLVDYSAATDEDP